MLHRNRIWTVTQVDSAESLAVKLSQFTWTGCQAFLLDDHIYANDATSGDGAQEYAVLKASSDGSSLIQIESIAFSWCTELQALSLIHRVSAGDFDSSMLCRVSRARFQTSAEHSVCNLCA